ncbi:MAG: ParB/RepB/Spo0J family partition protein [Candidatus Tectimicrobiota bacterium]
MTPSLAPLETILLAKIDEDPAFQVRRQWDPATDAGMESLAASLAGPEGLIHPVVVVRLAQPTTFGRMYTLIAGHRRLAAARHLGWRTIPARVLPACDLTAPLARLHLLAMAVRENTEREDLSPADRRAALQQLEALYAAVYPETATRPRSRGVDAEAPAPFSRWAARVTQLSERTIRRDLRAVLLAGGLAASPPAGSSESPPVPSPSAGLANPVARTIDAAQQAMTALQELVTATIGADPMGLPETQSSTLQQTLQTLQATVTRVLPAVQGPAAHPVLPLTRLAEAHLVPLRDTLQALRAASPETWATVPPGALQHFHTAMTTLLADWQALAPHLQAQLPGASAMNTLPPSGSWGPPVALA